MHTIERRSRRGGTNNSIETHYNVSSHVIEKVNFTGCSSCIGLH